MNGGNIQLIKAVVCAGLYPNVTVAPAALCPSSTSANSGGGGGGVGGKKSGGGGSKGGAEKTAGEVTIGWFVGWCFFIGAGRPEFVVVEDRGCACLF